jgi:hypothetical protein
LPTALLSGPASAQAASSVHSTPTIGRTLISPGKSQGGGRIASASFLREIGASLSEQPAVESP